MLTFDQSLSDSQIPDFSHNHSIPFSIADVLFFDIETTGFRASSSHLYLIGVSFFQEGHWVIRQWLSEAPQKEAQLLRTFSELAASYHTLIHFNGTRFDIPYLEEKLNDYGLDSPFPGLQSMDLYAILRPWKKTLGLTRMNQKSLETFLGIRREDRYDGGKLIPVYRDYVKTGKDSLRDLLLLHNREDVAGMLRLTSMLSYASFFETIARDLPPVITAVKELNGVLCISFSLPQRLPVPLSRRTPHCEITLHDTRGECLIPICNGELSHFFPNWKDYFYLPQEDLAIHKSVAAYVDKAYREKATPQNCRIKKSGRFLPQPVLIKEPSFRSSYEDTLSWFLYEEELLADHSFMEQYLLSLLQWCLEDKHTSAIVP